MAKFSLSIGRPTLADHILGRGLGLDLILLVAGVALTGLAAQFAVPSWPIPLTAQAIAVLVVGSALGALRGTLSIALYAVLGTLGLPVFNGGASGFGYIQGPGGGYLVGFIAAAAFTGWMAQRGFDRTFAFATLSAAVGIVLVHSVGVPWLAVVSGSTIADAVVHGSVPIALGAIVKVLVAAAIITVAWRALSRSELHEDVILHGSDE